MAIYEPEEFTRARYWQQKYLELMEAHEAELDAVERKSMSCFCDSLVRKEEMFELETKALKEEIDVLKIRLFEHREAMELFNELPWYDKMRYNFDLESL